MKSGVGKTWIFPAFFLDFSDTRWYYYYDSHSTTDDILTDRVITLLRQKGDENVNISSDVIRGYNDTMILFVLLKAPSYGYDISRQIKTLAREKYVMKETTLYSAFTRMEKNGYVESYSEDAQNGKRRTYYKITQKGRAYYRDKCEEWLLTKEVVENFIAAEQREENNGND